jgi:prevent-host-death family protein
LTNLTNTGVWSSVVVMVRLINLYDAKTQLSALVEEAAAGAEIIIAKAGRPRARLVAVKTAARRTPGKGKGKGWMSDDFDAPLPPDILKTFGIE